ncbi:MAG: ATP-binding cassette domain-containing protein [Tannerellaceae bacterium]|nr:ATP-binding cassette domain-containing protein [Tannerellaceae bacterium]
MSQCLEVDSVVKYFGEEADILSDVSLHCYPGEIIGIFGRNGTGESTLFNIIFGSLTAQNVFIRINGKVCKRSPFFSGLIAYLPQHTYLPLYLSVKDVVKAYVLKEQVNRFLGNKFLFKRRDAKVRDLSGGELRYLEVKLILFARLPIFYWMNRLMDYLLWLLRLFGSIYRKLRLKKELFCLIITSGMCIK